MACSSRGLSYGGIVPNRPPLGPISSISDTNRSYVNLNFSSQHHSSTPPPGHEEPASNTE